MWGWLAPLLIGLAFTAVAYLLMPKPKRPKPPPVQEMEAPTAEAGRPMPVLIGGTKIMEDPNVLWFGEIETRRVNVRV